ncbi:MAG: electron transport complex subunit RsxC [Patescibacteria group bacterium]|nr:electron transport complex subunit RsxC [Patescibacteria group bacterium]
MPISSIIAQITFARGVHPPECKELAEYCAVEVLPTPSRVVIPLLQHLGAACLSTVKPRQEVELGDLVGEATAPVSAPVHASVRGRVGRAAMATLPNGRHVPAISIDAAGEQPLEGEALLQEIHGGDYPIDGLGHYMPQAIRQAARTAGLVGLGGAAFPTHIKLSPRDETPIDTLLINGCECEPYLTADDQLMQIAPRPILCGAMLAQIATGARRVIVAIEGNKPRAIHAMEDAVRGTPVEVRELKPTYPQGGEKQLIDSVLDREIPAGKLPMDVGVVVMNVGTAAALARAVVHGRPLTHRIVTVSGAGIRRPANLLVPIGASYRHLVEHCGGLRDNAVRIVAGGPMMGFTLGSLDTPVTKGTSGITVLSEWEVRRAKETPCVRCGRCVEVCPMHLVPTKLGLAARAGNAELARRHYISVCVECGCCAYVCPAQLPLVQLIRLGKVLARK